MWLEIRANRVIFKGLETSGKLQDPWCIINVTLHCPDVHAVHMTNLQKVEIGPIEIHSCPVLVGSLRLHGAFPMLTSRWWGFYYCIFLWVCVTFRLKLIWKAGKNKGKLNGLWLEISTGNLISKSMKIVTQPLATSARWGFCMNVVMF